MRVILSILFVVAIAFPASANECVPTSSHPEVDLTPVGFDLDGDGSPTIWYVDNDLCQLDGCALSIWFYEESNGIPGLQRSDEVKDDTCGGAIEGDTIID